MYDYAPLPAEPSLEDEPEGLALVDRNQGDWDGEIQKWECYIEDHPTSRVGYDKLAALYESQGDVEAEIGVWERYIKSNPHERVGYQNLVTLHKMKGDVDGEIQVWIRYIENNPHGAGKYIMAASLCKKKGDMEGILRVSELCIANYPNRQWGFEKMDSLANTHQAVGNRVDAMIIRMRLVKLQPDNARRQKDLADAQLLFLEHVVKLNLTANMLGNMDVAILESPPIDDIPIKIPIDDIPIEISATIFDYIALEDLPMFFVASKVGLKVVIWIMQSRFRVFSAFVGEFERHLGVHTVGEVREKRWKELGYASDEIQRYIVVFQRLLSGLKKASLLNI